MRGRGKQEKTIPLVMSVYVCFSVLFIYGPNIVFLVHVTVVHFLVYIKRLCEGNMAVKTRTVQCMQSKRHS